jgi:hypothetical protein
MNNMKTAPVFLPALACLLLIFGGCSGTATRSDQSDTLIDLVGTDIKNLDKVDYARVVKRLATATGVDYVALKDPLAPRQQGPRTVWNWTDGVLVLDGDEQQWGITAIDANGKKAWRRAIQLGEAADLGDWQLGADRALPTPSLHLNLASSDGQIGRLIWALSDTDMPLVRAETAGGDLAIQHIAAEHPDLLVGPGDLNAKEPIPALAALIALAQPSAKARRQDASVRSNLNALSASTNIWVAETAAYCLILP